jgi:hypothetical protein
MYVQILRNPLRHPHPRPIPLNYATLHNLSRKSHRFGFLDTELPVTLYRHQERNEIPITRLQYSLPQPVLLHPPLPPALVCHNPRLPGQCSTSGSNSLQPEPLTDLRPILLPTAILNINSGPVLYIIAQAGEDDEFSNQISAHISVYCSPYQFTTWKHDLRPLALDAPNEAEP